MARPVSVEFLPVATTAEVAPGTAISVMVGDREVALFNIDGTFHAIENSCPHQGGPLAEGYIEGDTVTCPWHAWCFRLTDGKMTLGDYSSVEVFDVKVVGDGVAVARESRPETR